MVNVRRSIDIISPHNGKHYTSATTYERDVDRAGKHILSDREYKDMREKAYDERASHKPTPPEQTHNHVHIDFANGKVIKSRRDINA